MTTTPAATQVPQARVVRQLRDLGVRAGGVLVVHTSFSSTGPVDGGPAGLIAALHEAVGPRGTLVMPSMSSDDESPFDPARTPCPDMGVTADTFWRRDGVVRSDNPHAFAAAGPLAAAITAPHPIDPPHGSDSPVGRARDHDAHVLLLGVGHDANTTIHLAENEAGVRYRRCASTTPRSITAARASPSSMTGWRGTACSAAAPSPTASPASPGRATSSPW